MPASSPRRALYDARRRLASARRQRERLVAEVALGAAAEQHAARTAPARATRHRASGEQARRVASLARARAAERTAKTAVIRALAATLADDPAEDMKRLEAAYPIVLLPVRLETRFDLQAAPPTLKVRVYPDEIHADTHEPALTPAERAAGLAFWQAAWQPAEEAAAWQQLLAQLPAPRAAWVARATRPTNLAQRPSGQPAFPATPARSASWTRAAEARLLPDRWIVLAYRDGREVHRAVGAPIAEPLALTLSPSGDPDDQADLSDAGLCVDADVAWAFDLQRAEAAGMAVRIPLTAEDVARGFDRLLVVGVKASVTPDRGSALLAELVDAHHYTRGLAFVPAGTPTNNTEAEPAGFPPADPGGAVSHAVELGPAAASKAGHGARFSLALGLREESVAHLDGAGRADEPHARAMNESLWPATLGYALEQLMAPVFTPAAIADVRRHFVDHVRGRGHFPVLRVGASPYATLAVGSLARWQAGAAERGVAAQLPGALRRLRGLWAQAVQGVPRIGRSNDPDADLVAVLGMDAATREVRVRQVVGQEAHLNLLQFVGSASVGLDFTAWRGAQQRIANAVLAAIGQPSWQPRVLGAIFGNTAPRFRFPLVADPPLSEWEPLAVNYIRGIRLASIEQLRTGRFGLPQGTPAPNALLYLLLRQAALLEYARVAFELLLRHGLATEPERREPELVGIVPGTEGRLTVWQRFERPIPALTRRLPLGRYLLETRGKAETAPIAAYQASLRALEELPTAELERLFAETLDICSHRLDAWIASLPAKRLQELRAVHPLGSHVGAYGWLEGLRPASAAGEERRTLADGRTARVPPGSGGYVQAPSLDHAAAAALLRNARLSQAGDERARYVIDLSSQRVRTAREVLDAVRQGQPLGAVLGYRFERGLHEGHAPLALDRYIEPFRRLFPLVADKGADSGEPTEAIAARNVVDGLALRAAAEAGTISFGTAGLPASGADRAAIEAELRALDAVVDGVADLLTAESVYQLVRGNTTAATATLDAMAQGLRPPDPEIARTPRGGATLTHRVAVVLGDEPLPLAPPWPERATPRAGAEPHLDGWVAQLLGDPGAVRCVVSYRDGAASARDTRQERTVALSELGLRPLDVLALAEATATADGTAELDARVADAVRAAVPAAADLRITYAADERADRTTTRSFPELFELARAIAAVVRAARPLGPQDLLLSEAAASAQAADLLEAEARERAQAALDALAAARDALTAALAEVQTGSPSGGQASAALRTALEQAASFGVASAYPPAGEVEGDALAARARGVFAELARRLAEAEALLTAPDTPPARVAQAVFGREFVFLPRFRPAESAALAEALAAGPALVGDPHAVAKWLQQVARVRPALGRWRTLALYAEALGAAPPRFAVAQLPHVPGARWLGLPFGPDAAPPSGRLSLALHQVGTVRADGVWGGLLLDAWTETIPRTAAQTGIALHYDGPSAAAPQAVLIAVPPDPRQRTWDLPTLVDTVNETLDLAQLRAVDGELLGPLGQLLPALYLAANPRGDTISTDLRPALTAEPTVIT